MKGIVNFKRKGIPSCTHTAVSLSLSGSRNIQNDLIKTSIAYKVQDGVAYKLGNSHVKLK